MITTSPLTFQSSISPVINILDIGFIELMEMLFLKKDNNKNQQCTDFNIA